MLAVTPCRALQSLDLSGNKISDIEVVVATLQQMKQLRELTLKVSEFWEKSDFPISVDAIWLTCILH